MIFSLYIFNRRGTCLLLQRWNEDALKFKREQDEKSLSHEKKNIYGLLFSMKSFVNKLAPRKLEDLEVEPFHSFCTGQYKLHYFETPTGLRFVLLSDPTTPNLQQPLKTLHSLYVQHVVLNPLRDANADTPVDSPAFKTKVDALVKALPRFDLHSVVAQ